MACPKNMFGSVLNFTGDAYALIMRMKKGFCTSRKLSQAGLLGARAGRGDGCIIYQGAWPESLPTSTNRYVVSAFIITPLPWMPSFCGRRWHGA